MKRATPVTMADPAGKSAFQIGREYRTLRTGARAEELAAGVAPEDLPSNYQAQTIVDEAGNVPAGTTITPEQINELQMDTTTQAKAAKVGAVSPEQVSIVDDVAKAAEPKAFKAATIGADDLAKVPETAVVEAASGTCFTRNSRSQL